MKKRQNEPRHRYYDQATCRICNASFTRSRKDARYCSARCRKKISRLLTAAGFTGKLKPLMPTLEKIEAGTWGR